MTKSVLRLVESINFIDLAAQQKKISSEIQNAINKVLAHGKYIMGPEVKELENVLSEFCGVKHTVSCSNGTDALIMALMALGVKAGDAVFTPSFTFAATAEAVAFLGATPIFVDVNADDYNISITSLENAYQKAQKLNLNAVGVIAVDLFGLPADYDPLEAFTKDKNMWVMADSAQSLGAEYKGKRVGQMGVVTTTSFFPAKPLGCYGDGGAIFTDNDELADTLRSIRVHGKGRDKYDNIRLGMNGRLDTIQAAILLEKQKIFTQEIEKRNQVAAYYNQNLQDLLKTPVIEQDRKCVWAQYTLQTQNEDERKYMMNTLSNAGIPSVVYYPIPLHLQTCYKNTPSADDMSISVNLSKSVFSLPMHPYLEITTQDYIIETIRNAFNKS